MNRIRFPLCKALSILLATAASATAAAGAEPLPVTRLPVVQVHASLSQLSPEDALLARAPVRLPTITVTARALPAVANQPLATQRPWLPAWAVFDPQQAYLAEWLNPAEAGAALLGLGTACAR